MPIEIESSCDVARTDRAHEIENKTKHPFSSVLVNGLNVGLATKSTKGTTHPVVVLIHNTSAPRVWETNNMEGVATPEAVETNSSPKPRPPP